MYAHPWIMVRSAPWSTRCGMRSAVWLCVWQIRHLAFRSCGRCVCVAISCHMHTAPRRVAVNASKFPNTIRQSSGTCHSGLSGSPLTPHRYGSVWVRQGLLTQVSRVVAPAKDNISIPGKLAFLSPRFVVWVGESYMSKRSHDIHVLHKQTLPRGHGPTIFMYVHKSIVRWAHDL